jgi:peptide/nickel transport system substrate-binding protein
MRLLAALAASAVALAACGSDDGKSSSPGTGTVVAKRGGTITVAAEEELKNFNQNTSADNSLWGAVITRLVWPQMYVVTPDLKMVPGAIADGPAQVVSQEPFTVRWKIKPAAVWSDGTPVTSDDLEYTYLACNDKVDPGEPTVEEDGETYTGVDCGATTGFDMITKFTKVDAKTAEAEFDSPIGEYESLFSRSLPPAHVARTKGENAWSEAFVDSPIVSAGPYMLKEWKKGDSLTLTRNEKYFGTPPNLDTIVFRFIEKGSDQIDALRNREVDVIAPGPQLDLVEGVRELDGVHYESNLGLTWEQISFNLKNELLGDDTVRRAVVLGIDRRRIVADLIAPITDSAVVLNNRFVMTGFPGYQDNAGDFANRDVAAAKRLLDGAGWVEGGDGIRAKGGKRLTLRIATTPGDALRERTEELLQAQLKEIGVELKIDNPEDLFALIGGGEETQGEWDMALFANVGGPTVAIDMSSAYTTGSPYNVAQYSDEQVDALLEQAIAEVDAAKRMALLNDVDKVLWGASAMPDLPLYQKPSFLAYRDTFVNIVDNTTSEGLTWNAEQWGSK